MTRITLMGLAAGVAAMAAPWIMDPLPPVTFYKDVLPILQDHCLSCHQPGQSAPMSLMTYREVKLWAPSVRRVVLNRRMPPWPMDGRYFHRLLKPGEIETLVKWVDAGTPKGDSSDAPPFDEWAAGRL
jgi:hypothetical protein